MSELVQTSKFVKWIPADILRERGYIPQRVRGRINSRANAGGAGATLDVMVVITASSKPRHAPMV